MGKVIVIEFVSLDGVVEDPDGSGGTPWGGWAFRHGPEAVAGDKFRLGEVLDTGVMLLGRVTWQLFSGIWPSRDDEFSRKMAALAVVDALELDHYRYFHSTRAELLRRLGDVAAARAAYRNALELATTDPERRFLQRRLTELPGTAPPG